jgi:hypothetical protein
MRRCLVLLVLVVPTLGCERQPEFAVVEGRITRNGRPVANIEVAFYADENTRGPRTAGTTDAEGRYRLQTEAGQAGAVIGHYRVCLLDRDPALVLSANKQVLTQAQKSKLPSEVAANLAVPAKPPASRVPDEYTRPWETPLRAEVNSGTQTLDFRIP